MQWFGESEIPFSIEFTKIDKLRKNQVQSNITSYKKTMRQTWEDLPPVFVTSSVNREGGEEILDFIDRINAEIVG